MSTTIDAGTAMDATAYRLLHEQFMKNHNGTHFPEVLAHILPTYLTTFCVVALQAVLIHPLTNTPARFLLEYATIVWTVILHLTILNERIYELAGTLILICLTIAAKQLCNRTHIIAFVTRIPRRHPDFVACLRATTSMLTAVCILAVDFRAFPRRLAKTEAYGFALMDTGVGLYVACNGITDSFRYAQLTAPMTARRMRRLSASVAPMLLLGAVRFYVTTALEYQQHVTEYGVHWNFFITLALTRLIGWTLLSVASWAGDEVADRRVAVHYLTIGVLFVHQAGLLAGLGRWVMSADDEGRNADGWVAANREGLVSVLGYVGLYLASVVLGRWMQPTEEEDERAEVSSGDDADEVIETCTARGLLKRVQRIALASLCVGKLAWDCERTFGVSRRLADLGYVLWILCITGTMTVLYMLLEVFYHCLVFWRAPAAAADETSPTTTTTTTTSASASDLSRYCPLLMAAINYNGLAFFLLANLMTGAVNLTFQTLMVDAAGCVFIVSVYMFVLCAIMVFLYVNEIRLKF